MRVANKHTETDNLFEILADRVPVALYIVQDAQFRYVNLAFQNITGYKKEELLGRNSLELVFPQDREMVRRKAISMLKGKSSLPYEFRVINKDGSTKWVSESVVSIQYRGRRATLGYFVDVTEHKQIQATLQAEKNKLQSLVDAMEDHITIRDRDYTLIFMNEHAKKLWGDRTGQKCYRVFEGQDKVCNGCPAQKAFQNGESHASERKRVTPSGEVIFWEVRTSPIRGADGEIVACLEIARNITEHKKMEEALQQSEKKYRALFDNTLTGTVVIDAETMKLTMANQAAANMFGFSSAEEAIGINPLDLISPEYRERAFEGIANIADMPEEQLRRAEEFRMMTKDGREIWILAVGARILHEGRLAALVSFIDITERKKMEKTLWESREQLKNMFESVSDGISVIDLNGIIKEVNDRTVEMHGFASKDELIGKNAFELIAPRDREKIANNIRKSIRNREPIKGAEYTLLRADGSEFPGELSTSALKDNSGNVVGHITVARDITERKKTERAYNLQRAYFQQLFDSSPDATAMVDSNDRVIRVNKGFEMLFGYSGEEVMGKSLNELIVPEQDNQVALAYTEKVLRGEVVRKESARRHKDGSLIDVSILGYPIRSDDRVVGAYVIYTDITKRKKTEEALNSQRAYFQQLFDGCPDAIALIDRNERVIQANKGFEMLFGYSQNEAKGKTVYELIVPEHERQIAAASIADVLKGKIVRRESMRRHKDGSLIDVAILGYPIRSDDRVVGAYVIYTDITERKKAEKAVKQAAQEWRRTFDSITDAVSIHDRDFRILRANKAFADLFHVEISQVIGKHCYELHKAAKPRPGCPLQHTLATKKPATSEFYESNLRKFLLESTSPIFDQEGEVVATVHITRDITAQKQQSERLMMADRLASIGELAAGTAHELNNPLTSIIGFAQMLKEKDIPDDIREDVEFIYNEAQRAANVTKNLLTFARRHTPVKQPSQINNIIEDVLKLHAYELKVNGIEVKKQLAPDLPEIMVDYFQMQQVFLNIIINAEYFMIEAHSKGTLTITTERRNSKVVISIADDGPGIPPENLSRIFDPFFTTKPVGKGTGLGLSICHGIVTEHGGQIYAVSQLGKGATIVVELPINHSQPFPGTS